MIAGVDSHRFRLYSVFSLCSGIMSEAPGLSKAPAVPEFSDMIRFKRIKSNSKQSKAKEVLRKIGRTLKGEKKKKPESVPWLPLLPPEIISKIILCLDVASLVPLFSDFQSPGSFGRPFRKFDLMWHLLVDLPVLPSSPLTFCFLVLHFNGFTGMEGIRRRRPRVECAISSSLPPLI